MPTGKLVALTSLSGKCYYGRVVASARFASSLVLLPGLADVVSTCSCPSHAGHRGLATRARVGCDVLHAAKVDVRNQLPSGSRPTSSGAHHGDAGGLYDSYNAMLHLSSSICQFFIPSDHNNLRRIERLSGSFLCSPQVNNQRLPRHGSIKSQY
jgi:hypothetical protein